MTRKRKHKQGGPFFVVRALPIRDLSDGKILGCVRVNPLETEGRLGNIPTIELSETVLILRNGIEIPASSFNPIEHGGLLFDSQREAEEDGIARLRQAYERGGNR
jgi:hypothetical protein